MENRLKNILPYYAVILSAIFLYIGCNRTKERIDYRTFEDFSFRKIQMYLYDSSKYFSSIDSVYAHLPYKRRMYEIYNCKRGYFYTIKHDYEKSLLYSDSALAAVKKLDNDPAYPYWYSVALSNKADDLHALKRYNEAFNYYFLAREAIFKTGDTCLYTSYSARLGLVAYQHQHYKEAASYFKQAFEQQFHCRQGDSSFSGHVIFAHQQANLDNIGLCYSKMGMSDSALFYYDNALAYIENNYHHAFRFEGQKKIVDTDFIAAARAVIYGNKAKELMTQGNDSAAERLLKESIRINSMSGRAIEDVPYSLAKLADLYIKTGRLHLSEVLLKQLKKGLDTSANAEIVKRWYLLQSKYEEKRGNLPASNQYLNKYVALKDSMDAVDNSVLRADLNKEFSYLQSEYDLNVLQKKDDRKSFYLVAAALAILMFAITMLLIWRNYAQSKKHILALGKLNEKISDKNLHLQNALVALQQSQEENDQMMKVVAHDLRNPVGGIAASSALLLRDNHNYPDEQRKMLEMIHASSNHAVELIQDLMYANRQPIAVHVPVDLLALITYCVEMLSLAARQKKQEIILHPLPARVSGDREKLWRVFSNLINNAIKFSPENENIEIRFVKENGRVIVSVEDRGVGIPRALHDKIFHITETAKRTGTSGEPSFGLGLFISKQIVEAHSGEIWFTSGDDEGTTFFVSLPLI
ncbi:MAG: tetratricopeptide repeat-containing sensor histidine kinase [Chitinophagaceae bacterium]|nr:tetratricopeptide repeat-containing sensor histidine kinase [Chitinophagaceae bacterium]